MVGCLDMRQERT